MGLLLRLVLVVLRARRGPLESVIHARVLPTSPDLNFCLNDGRCLTLMDLGRVDLMVRTGMVGERWRRRWKPVIASATIRFRHPLGPWRRFVAGRGCSAGTTAGCTWSSASPGAATRRRGRW
ncbi:MAG TPA: thioesterase family protein [Longimicrobium sp.]|nr:thioesterase family protein [Longimicrobium sp.]